MYTCEAENSWKGESRIQIKVLYPPVVTIKKRNLKQGIERIQCMAHGEPQEYHFYPWEHTSELGQHVRFLNNTQHITMHTYPRYKLNGVYICRAKNGIADRFGNEVMMGNTSIKTKNRPIFVSENQHKQFGRFGQDGQIVWNVYCYPTFYRKLNINGQDSTLPPRLNITINNKIVIDEIYGVHIQLKGQEIVLKMSNLTESDFTIYDLRLSNRFGESNFTVKLAAADTPEVPKQVQFIPGVNDILVTWIRNFNGGTDQHFLVEYKKNEDLRWLQEGPINDTLNAEMSRKLDRLKPDTYYMVRVFAVNSLGNGNKTESLVVKTLGKPEVPKQVRLIPGVNNIVVTWKGNFNGGTDQHFVVEYKTNEAIRWLQEGPINDTLKPSLSHKLDGLETDRYYMIRVFAVNSFGNGNKTDVLIVKTLEDETKMDTLILVPIGAAFVLLLVFSNVCNWYMQKRTRIQMQPVNNSSADHPEENNGIQYGPYDEIDFQTDSDSSLHHSENSPIQNGPYDEIDLQTATYLEVVNSNSTTSLKCLPESEGIISLEASNASLSINSFTSSESSHECVVPRQESTGYLNPYNVLHHDSQTIQQNTYKFISRLDNLTKDHTAGNIGIQNGPSDEIEFQTGTYLPVVNSSLTPAINCLAESERMHSHDVWEHSPTNSESSHECVISRNDKDSYLNPCYLLQDDTENKHHATYTTMKRSSSTLLKEVDS